MPDTVVGLFRSRVDADRALGKLKDAGFGPDQVSVSTPNRRRRGRYALKLLLGLVLGTVLGAVVGAAVAGFVPGVPALIPGNKLGVLLIGAFAGAMTGLVAGGLVSMSASGDRALFYEQEVEAGRILITVAGPGLERAREIMRAEGAMEATPVEAPLERPRPESG
jgi:hypothetical protein